MERSLTDWSVVDQNGNLLCDLKTIAKFVYLDRRDAKCAGEIREIVAIQGMTKTDPLEEDASFVSEQLIAVIKKLDGTFVAITNRLQEITLSWKDANRAWISSLFIIMPRPSMVQSYSRFKAMAEAIISANTYRKVLALRVPKFYQERGPDFRAQYVTGSCNARPPFYCILS